MASARVATRSPSLSRSRSRSPVRRYASPPRDLGRPSSDRFSERERLPEREREYERPREREYRRPSSPPRRPAGPNVPFDLCSSHPY